MGLLLLLFLFGVVVSVVNVVMSIVFVVFFFLVLGSVQVLYKHVRGGGGYEGNAYFAYVVRGRGLEAKCLYCLCKRSKFLFT